MSKLVECTQCLGAKEIMTPKETKGFEYKKCSLCNGHGKVEQQLADDFVFAMNEDNFETNDDW
jgi:DnaJ-class molecular chaperone